MPKIITVTPNPAIDRTYLLGEMTPGEVMRAEGVLMSAGGKGINVARALRTLGAKAIATGFAGGSAGEQFIRLLDEEGIEHEFVDVTPAETRYAILIVDQASGRQTVINEAGPELTSEDVADLQRTLAGIAQGADGIVLSGSLPPGVSPKRYRTLIERANRSVKLTLLDATGELLSECIAARPSILKINRAEARTLGIIIEDWQSRAVDVALGLRREFGIDYIALTDGANGAVLAGPTSYAKAQMPRLDGGSAVGSGDSFAAGLIYALTTGPDDIPGALRLAAACGGANALTDSPGAFSRDQMEWVSGRINLG